MQGHDILFDIEKKIVGFAESKCDYNYLISGTKSEEFKPFNLVWDIAIFYIVRVRVRVSFLIGSFILAHLILGALYVGLRMVGYPFGANIKSSSSNGMVEVGAHKCLKSKNSEETAIMLELEEDDE